MRKNLDLLSSNQKYDYPLKSYKLLENLYDKMKMKNYVSL